MKGIENIKNLVEVNKAWDEQLGMSVGVAIAESIYPKRIEGIKPFDTYRMEILRGHIGMSIIQDRRLSWDCGPKSKAVVESGRYFSYSEFENFRHLIVIEGTMIPPNFGRFMPDYDCCGISCEICGKDFRTISLISDSDSEDQAIFKSIKVNSVFDDWSHTRKIMFSIVFGFNHIVKPHRIKIVHKKSSRYCIGTNFLLLQMNDRLFPRQNFNGITHPENYLTCTQADEIDELEKMEMPF